MDGWMESEPRGSRAPGSTNTMQARVHGPTYSKGGGEGLNNGSYTSRRKAQIFLWVKPLVMINLDKVGAQLTELDSKQVAISVNTPVPMQGCPSHKNRKQRGAL